MEEYLQYMKTLRFQMNDVEDQAMKISVQEHMHFATIQTMENDLNSAKSELKQLNEDAERMMQAKGEICSQILEKQRKIASLESDVSTLSQTLELIQQEKVSLGAKIIEKSNIFDHNIDSTYYTKVAEDINLKFQDQQDWVNANMIRGEVEEQDLVKLENAKQASETEGFSDAVGGISGTRIYTNPKNLVEGEDLLGKLESAEAKLSEVSKKKCAVVLEKSKIKQSIEELKNELNDFKPELRAMDDVTLEEEYKALLSDQAGETEYSRSLQDKIAKLKGISSVIKCTCGKEYKAGVLNRIVVEKVTTTQDKT
ncbi:myosin heavy chain, striated muscle [Cucumis melo var. makuwa]|uniref:Myosin heavy chain, striated muscle n=1 Tax=Cucumis melo var. makuwa TaxID=1194695 RepID=A0A5D3C8F7_CUCMM|nr:myosin heavy chain, striated muscle [Cucumis melo var. makuwa]